MPSVHADFYTRKLLRQEKCSRRGRTGWIGAISVTKLTDGSEKPKGRRARRPAAAAVPTRLREVIANKFETLEELAEKLGWPLSKLSKLRSGKQAPTLPDLVELAAILEVTVSELLHPDHISPLHVGVEPVPPVPLEFLRSLNDQGILTLRDTWGGETILLPKLSGDHTFATVYTGDGMDRYLRPGSKIRIDPGQRNPTHGHVYLVEIEDRLLLREYRGDGGAPRWVANSLARIDDIFVADVEYHRVIGRAVAAEVAL